MVIQILMLTTILNFTTYGYQYMYLHLVIYSVEVLGFLWVRLNNKGMCIVFA